MQHVCIQESSTHCCKAALTNWAAGGVGHPRQRVSWWLPSERLQMTGSLILGQEMPSSHCLCEHACCCAGTCNIGLAHEAGRLNARNVQTFWQRVRSIMLEAGCEVNVIYGRIGLLQALDHILQHDRHRAVNICHIPAVLELHGLRISKILRR
jgi:hypothetical protein